MINSNQSTHSRNCQEHISSTYHTVEKSPLRFITEADVIIATFVSNWIHQGDVLSSGRLNARPKFQLRNATASLFKQNHTTWLHYTTLSLTHFPSPVRSDSKVLLMTDKSGTVLALYTFLTSLNSISRLVYYVLWIRKMSEGTSLCPFLSNNAPARISQSDSAEAFTSNLKTHFQLVLRCSVKIKSDVWLQQHVTSIFLKSNSMLKKRGGEKMNTIHHGGTQ